MSTSVPCWHIKTRQMTLTGNLTDAAADNFTFSGDQSATHTHTQWLNMCQTMRRGQESTWLLIQLDIWPVLFDLVSTQCSLTHVRSERAGRSSPVAFQSHTSGQMASVSQAPLWWGISTSLHSFSSPPPHDYTAKMLHRRIRAISAGTWIMPVVVKTEMNWKALAFDLSDDRCSSSPLRSWALGSDRKNVIVDTTAQNEFSLHRVAGLLPYTRGKQVFQARTTRRSTTGGHRTCWRGYISLPPR